MLTDEHILVTGASGRLGGAFVASLARRNRVTALARFTDRGSKALIEAMGAAVIPCDLAADDWPPALDTFTYVIHLAAAIYGADRETSDRTNVVGTTRLMERCASARGFFTMSTFSVYEPHPDPTHAYIETDPCSPSFLQAAEHYSASKIRQEEVAREMSAALGLPTVIGRLNIGYDAGSGMVHHWAQRIRSKKPVYLPSDEFPVCPIHARDVVSLAQKMLVKATSPAITCNLSGDEVISSRAICEALGAGLREKPDLRVVTHAAELVGLVSDNVLRTQLAGGCQVSWQEGIDEVVRKSL